MHRHQRTEIAAVVNARRSWHPRKLPVGGTMETTMGSASILEVCTTKLMEFVSSVDNRDMVWLQETKEEAQKMFSSDSTVEPELMPKTPSQRNRRRKKQFSSIQDKNKPPTRKRLSRRASRRSSQHNQQLLRNKDRLEKLVMVAADNSSFRRGTRTQVAAAAASSPPESPTVLPKKPVNLAAMDGLVPVVEIIISDQQSAENFLVAHKAKTAALSLGCKDESVPKKQAESHPEPAPGTSLGVPTEVPEVKAAGLAWSVAKLQIAQPVAVTAKPGRAPSSPGAQTQPETELPLDLLEGPQTQIGPCCDRRSVCRRLLLKSSQAHGASLIRKASVVPKTTSSSARWSSRKLAQKPAVTGCIICHSYLERVLDVEVPRKAR
ncbi:inner centromere protein-like [Vombatus ursinus]|uniref:inner centromere protein-like n=1 Tax=Vombatus ursinus TaxID=29139 RepID=UPI000FFCEBF1|nr:inner centromere protein-like [Vombatus ursinus]